MVIIFACVVLGIWLGSTLEELRRKNENKRRKEKRGRESL